MSLKVILVACVAAVALADKAPVHLPPVYVPTYHAPEPVYHAPAHYKEPEYPTVPPKYNYNYGVADGYSGANFGHTDTPCTKAVPSLISLLDFCICCVHFKYTQHRRVTLNSSQQRMWTTIYTAETLPRHQTSAMSLKVILVACVAAVALADKAPVHLPPVYVPTYHAPEPVYHAPAHYKEPEYPTVPPKYNYNYGVADGYSGANFGHTESRDAQASNLELVQAENVGHYING
ncbi:uncharacterized protein LOC134778731 [Penaeus indicus]|uniref:uncharacterized protein LOC134778731 n=1 Tax=Penaeus indicus TaxID=29960 RepID=UPI00300D28F5